MWICVCKLLLIVNTVELHIFKVLSRASGKPPHARCKLEPKWPRSGPGRALLPATRVLWKRDDCHSGLEGTQGECERLEGGCGVGWRLRSGGVRRGRPGPFGGRIFEEPIECEEKNLRELLMVFVSRSKSWFPLREDSCPSSLLPHASLNAFAPVRMQW